MEHVAFLRSIGHDDGGRVGLLTRTTGRFYTHPTIGRHLAAKLWAELAGELTPGQAIRVIDPFAGDGRLVFWLVECALAAGRADLSWLITLWDLDETALRAAVSAGLELCGKHPSARIALTTQTQDTFLAALSHEDRYDVVVTNPPWDLLRPDHRELVALEAQAKEEYILSLRRYEERLRRQYPLSRPLRRFAGWGTQLSRVGVEVSIRLVRERGLLGLVTPASLLADDTSMTLRRHLMLRLSLKEIGYFPAEAKLFHRADITSTTLVIRAVPPHTWRPILRRFDRSCVEASAQILNLDRSRLATNGYSVPISFGGVVRGFEERLKSFQRFSDLAGEDNAFWAGRELDETSLASKLDDKGVGPFIKGRMVQRLRIVEEPVAFVRESAFRKAPSVSFQRIVWRDVSRPNQKRRMIATIIPANWIAGNSLGVAYFRDPDGFRLKVLLGLMLSFPFEYQLRGILSTGHVSLGAVRRVRIPDLRKTAVNLLIAELVDQALMGDITAEPRLEAASAHAYGVSEQQLSAVIDTFPKVTTTERDIILNEFRRFADVGHSFGSQ